MKFWIFYLGSMLVLVTAGIGLSQTTNNILGASTSVNYAPVADPQQVTLSVPQPVTITLTGYDGNGDTLTFSITTQPLQGTLTQFNPTAGQVTYNPPAQLSGTDTFTFSVTDGIATSGPATVTVVPPMNADFSLVAGPSRTITAGTSAYYGARVTPLGGFSGSVALSLGGLPAGATAAFSLNPVSGGSGTSILTVATSSTTPAGTYNLTVTGTSGSLTHTASIALVVNADFSLV